MEEHFGLFPEAVDKTLVPSQYVARDAHVFLVV
jgi:hypothetical protein